MGNFVSDDQAGAVGGGDKPAGAQAENTFQNNKVKQLVVLVRYKPADAGFDTGGASSMVGGVTGAIQGAVDAVESVMASIPGLDMFIKEDKTKTTSETEYSFFKDYKAWDSALKKIETGLKELNEENVTEKFEFSSTDSDGRKKDAKDLLSKVKSKMSSWSQYTAKVHFIGLGQGGNVVNECTDLMAKDSQFKSEKWSVKSVIYVATPLFSNQHLLNSESYKGDGAEFAFGSTYDLTQHALDCFEKNETLLKLIQDSNKNTLSLMVGKVKLRIISALSIILSGLHLSAGDTSELDKFKKIKDEVEGLVTDVIDLVKKIIDEGASFVKLGDLPEFSKIVDGYGDIPGKVIARLTQFIDTFTKSAADQAKSANISLSPKDLAGLLNCLCPLFDTISGSISIFKYGSPTSQELAKQVIDSAGATKVYAPTTTASENLDVDEAYKQKAAQAIAKGEPQMAGALVSKVSGLLAKAAEKNTEVSKMSDEEKETLAEAISCMVQPMLTTKKKLYQKLLHVIPFDLNTMMEDFTANKLMAIPGGGLSKLGIDFPDDLKKSIADADAQVKRLMGYFEKTDFNVPEDSLYFIYNTHNTVLKKPYGPILARIDQETGYLDFKKSKGFDAEVTLDALSYKQVGAAEKTDVLPAKELPVAAGA